jgi:hypothetical protein
MFDEYTREVLVKVVQVALLSIQVATKEWNGQFRSALDADWPKTAKSRAGSG